MFRGISRNAASVGLIAFILAFLCFRDASFGDANVAKEIRMLDTRMDNLAQRLTLLDREKERLEARLEELRREESGLRDLMSQEKEKLLRGIVSIAYIGELLEGVNAHNFVVASRLWSLEIMQRSLVRDRMVRIESMKRKLMRLAALRKQIDKNVTELDLTRNRYESMIQQLKALKTEKAKALEASKSRDKDLSLLPQIGDLRETPPSEPVTFHVKPSLAGMKGKLDLPVNGLVISGFSEKKNTPLPILRYNRGVFIRAEPGETVRSVADGQVVFARWFRDLGRMIIINHGEHFYSVYALLGTFLKNEGDRVLKGEPIGRVGLPELASEPGIYFEWRKNGRSLAIKEWFLISRK